MIWLWVFFCVRHLKEIVLAGGQIGTKYEKYYTAWLVRLFRYMVTRRQLDFFGNN